MEETRVSVDEDDSNIKIGEDEVSLVEVVTEFPTIVSQEVTKKYIKLVASVFVAIGAGLAVPYISFSVVGLTDAITGGGDFLGGAAILSLFGIVPLFASLFVAVMIGIFVGTETDDVRYGIVASGVGSYLGFIGMVLALVVATQFVDTGIVTSIIGLEIGSLLQELIVAGIGVGIAGCGGGYLGYKMKDTLHGEEQDAHSDEEGLGGLIAAIKNIPSSVKEPPVKSGIKLTAYAFGMVGIGYGIMVIALGWIAGDILAVTLTFIASYSVVFSAPFLAVYLGMKIGETSGMKHSVTAGSIGGLVGFVILVLVMSVLGSLGPDPGILEAVEGAGGAMEGDVGEAGTGLITGLVGTLPYGYEVSRIMIIGGIGSGIAGGLAAFSVNDYERWW